MPKFAFTPVEHDPFGPALEYARELGGAPKGPEKVDALGAAFGRDMSRLAGAFGGSFETVGNALLGDTQVEIGPDGSVSPIDPRLVDAAGTLSGLAFEGGLLAEKPAGALGVFAGRNAKTADQAALQLAQRYEKQGAPPELIHRETGWFRGGDGEWRFEIPDTPAKVDTSLLKPQDENANNLWWQTLHDLAGEHGYFDFHDMAKNAPEAEVDAVRRQADKAIGAAVPLNELMHHPALFAAYPDLAERPVFSHATGKGTSGLYNHGGDFFEISPEHASEQLPIALHEIQHAIQNREGFSTGGSQTSPESTAGGFALSNQLYNELYRIREKPVKTEEDLADMLYINGVLKQMQSLTPGQSGYHVLGGEVEARNVELRHGFNAYEIPPWQTEDVPRKYQNVRVLKERVNAGAK